MSATNDDTTISSPGSGKQRRDNRPQEFRQSIGAKVVAQYSAMGKQQLFSGVHDIHRYLNAITIQVVENAVEFPISTRAIGFSLQQAYLHICSRVPNIQALCSVHSIYRVALLQFSLRLAQVAKHRVMNVLQSGNHSYPILDYEIAQLIHSIPQQLSPVAGIINSVGQINLQSCSYYPYLPTSNILNPFIVSFSNLREMVVRLSNRDYPQVERQEFYFNNPIPGAVWETPQPDDGPVAPIGQNPILANPDAIIPPEYGVDQISQDIAAVRTLFAYIASKLPQFCARVTIDEKGSPGQLVSTVAVQRGIRIDGMAPVTGNCSAFYASVPMSDVYFALGCLTLLGETLEPPHPVRSPAAAVRSASYSWAALMNAMMN